MDVSDHGGGSADLDVRVRQARADDEDAVVSFTRDTWSERDGGDYLPDVFARWVETDGESQRTFVLDVNDGADVAGVIQGVLLSEEEAWAQGMRVNPEYRGAGLSPKLSRAVFRWAREAGATVCRNMVFSWNVAGLGQSRAVGFEPCAEFRWAEPAPEPDAEPSLEIAPDPAAAWNFWSGSDVRTALRGLAMDGGESWACSELRRATLREAADDDRLFVARDGGTRGVTYRAYEYERDGEDGPETRGVYGVAAWDTPDAARALLRAVARDAGERGLDHARVLIPEGVGWVTDVAAARCDVSAEPDFVMAADLTDPGIT